tara:strand:- start:5354 stop:5809 length:456 start_codon:yes stop_codon:yes gene_type:complete
VRNLLAVLLVFSAIVLLVVLNTINNKKTPSEIITVYSDCSLDKESCVVSLQGNREIIFKLEPKGFPAMEPLFLSVHGLNDIKNNLKIWFEGKGMNMGIHYMLPIPDQVEPIYTSYRYKGMIPVCTIDSKMVWLLKTEFVYEGNLHQIQFQL